MRKRDPYNVLGIHLDAVDYEAAVDGIIAAAQQRRPFAVSALAVHGVMTGVLDRTHRYRLNRLDLVLPDGQPVRWALNWLHGTGLTDRVYGPTLMLKVCERVANEGLSIYLYGGTDTMVESLSARLVEQFPGLRIAGSQPSRFRRLSPAERDETVAAIHGSGASLVFVGLGCPRQEVWAYEFRETIARPILAVGAAFSFHAGHTKQAPQFFQDRGLEWLWRLCHEPRRLWKRYLLLNPLYLTLLALHRTRLLRINPHAATAPTEEVLYG